jgi:DNA polymerase-3 subunit alpha
LNNDENRFKRINVQKIGSMTDLFNSPINEVSFKVNSDENLETISLILTQEGKTEVNINMIVDDKTLQFKLKNTRNLDRKSLNLLRKQDISSSIN